MRHLNPEFIKEDLFSILRTDRRMSREGLLLYALSFSLFKTVSPTFLLLFNLSGSVVIIFRQLRDISICRNFQQPKVPRHWQRMPTKTSHVVNKFDLQLVADHLYDKMRSVLPKLSWLCCFIGRSVLNITHIETFLCTYTSHCSFCYVATVFQSCCCIIWTYCQTWCFCLEPPLVGILEMVSNHCLFVCYTWLLRKHVYDCK